MTGLRLCAQVTALLALVQLRQHYIRMLAEQPSRFQSVFKDGE
jgi:hypothetical protein